MKGGRKGGRKGRCRKCGKWQRGRGGKRKADEIDALIKARTKARRENETWSPGQAQALRDMLDQASGYVTESKEVQT